MASDIPSVTISLVSHNQRRDLERLLPSLQCAASRVEAEILLVDNCSGDGGTEYVEQYASSVRVTRNRYRAGYGANHNVNLRLARGEYIVIMNTDMTVNSDVFSALRDFVGAHPEVGIASPKVLNHDGTVQGLNKRYPTVLDLTLRGLARCGTRGVFQRRLNHYEMRDVGYDRICDVPFLSGAFMFCRTDLLKRLGGFDEEYFLYFEDVDLCRRVQQTHRTVYFPDVSVVHYWKRASHKNLVHMYHFLKSGLRYFDRWGYRFL